MATKVPAILRIRRGTYDQWTGSNPILQEGELGYITSGQDAGKIKVGDGINTWNNLPLTVGEAIWGHIKGVLANQADLQDEFDKTNNLIVELENTVNSWIGRGGYLEAYDFGTATPTQDALTNEALAQIGITDSTEIWNGTKIANLFDGNVWALTNTQDTDPPIFEWSNQGPGGISQFGEGKGGYVVGASAADGIGYVQATPDGKGQVTGLVETNSLLTMGPPDYVNMESINRWAASPFTWTADRDGYVVCSIYQAISSRSSVLINGKRVFYSWNASPLGTPPIEIRKGDVIKADSANAITVTADTFCYFIPPVINPPAYLETMPLLDYSTVEQDTGRKWIDGKEIYVKTIQWTGSLISGDTILGNLSDYLPGALKLIKTEVMGNVVTTGQNQGTNSLDLSVSSSNQFILYSPRALTSRTWAITVWYTK